MQNAALRDPKNDLSPQSSTEEVSESTENGEGVSESAKKQQDESYYDEMLHFLPALVDVSAIQSPIVSVACGNQHSMILSGTKNGNFDCLKTIKLLPIKT